MKTKDSTNDGPTLERLSSGAFQGHFGGCPHCGYSDGPYNVGPAHWLVCREHRVRWWIGENLFRAWRTETSMEWEGTRRWLGDFQIVEPAYGNDSKLVGEADNDGR